MRLHFFKYKTNNIRLEYIDEIDDEVEIFISAKQGKQIFKRGKNELNWILKNPWVLSAPDVDLLNKKYHFSSVAKSFNFYSLKIRNLDNELIGFMIFAKRNESLKLPYCYHNNDVKTITDVINYLLVKWKIKTFTTFHAEIVHGLRNRKTPALGKRKIERKYIISSIYEEDLFGRDIEIQDGDADCSFT